MDLWYHHLCCYVTLSKAIVTGTMRAITKDPFCPANKFLDLKIFWNDSISSARSVKFRCEFNPFNSDLRKQSYREGTGACELAAREITVNLLRCGLKKYCYDYTIHQPPRAIHYGDLRAPCAIIIYPSRLHYPTEGSRDGVFVRLRYTFWMSIQIH